MPFADDLLEQAYDLAHKEPTGPKQASLRRAVSTAYYALFHYLIDEAVTKWAIAFAAWRAIRSKEEAQDFLLQLFLPKPARQ